MALSSDFMEAIVEPKQASTQGDTHLPYAQAVHVSFCRWCTSENKPPSMDLCTRQARIT